MGHIAILWVSVEQNYKASGLVRYFRFPQPVPDEQKIPFQNETSGLVLRAKTNISTLRLNLIHAVSVLILGLGFIESRC